MSLPSKNGSPASKPGSPATPSRKRDEEELARKNRKKDEDEDEEEEDIDDLDDDEDEDEEDDDVDEDEEEEDDEEEDDDEEELEVDEEELDVEEEEEEEEEDDFDDDEDLDDDEDFDDEEDDEEDDDFDDDEDDDDEDDEDDEEDDEEEDEDEEKKRPKKKKGSRGEAAAVPSASSSSGASGAATAAAAAAVGAAAAGAVAAKPASASKVGLKPTASPTAPAGGAKPVGSISGTSKRVTATTARSMRPSSASGGVSSSRRQPGEPKKRDNLKLAAILACVVLFLACVGMFIYKKDVILAKLSGSGPSKPANKGPVLPADIQKMMDSYAQAEKWYTEGTEKSKSEKLDELREAAKLLGQARDTWGEVSEFAYTFEGFEEKRESAARQLEAIGKSLRDLNKKIDEAESAERIERSRKNREESENAKASGTSSAPKKSETGMEELDEETFKKWETSDPSEHDRFKKLLEAGKARLIKKSEAKTEAPAKSDTPKPSTTLPDKAPDAPVE